MHVIAHDFFFLRATACGLCAAAACGFAVAAWYNAAAAGPACAAVRGLSVAVAKDPGLHAYIGPFSRLSRHSSHFSA